MRLEKTEQEHDDPSPDIETCLKLAIVLKGRLVRIGESHNFVAGKHIDAAQTAFICAAHARAVEAMLQNILTARNVLARNLLS
jgi:hypothetical protein